MLYNSVLMKRVTKRDRQLWISVFDLLSDFHAFAKAKEKIEGKPDGKSGPRLIYRCHSICRAIASQIPELTVVDGKYLGIGRDDKNAMTAQFSWHSWLVTPSGKIIEPYPVGFIAIHPMIVVNLGPYADFGYNLYTPDPGVTEKVMTPRMKRESERLVEAMAACRGWSEKTKS